MPGPIALKEGVYEVGRTEPADILLRIPTVSSRHALLRVGALWLSVARRAVCVVRVWASLAAAAIANVSHTQHAQPKQPPKPKTHTTQPTKRPAA